MTTRHTTIIRPRRNTGTGDPRARMHRLASHWRRGQLTQRPTEPRGDLVQFPGHDVDAYCAGCQAFIGPARTCPHCGHHQTLADVAGNRVPWEMIQ